MADPRQGGGRRHRRRRHLRPRRRRLRQRHRGGRRPPLHEHRLAVRRRRHEPLDRLPLRPARSVRRLHGRAAAKTCGLFERPFVSWRNDIALFMGPRQSGYSALDVDDLTAVEVRSHRAMAAHLEYYRAHAPGFEDAYMMLSAPQIGVRHARRLDGRGRGAARRWPEGTALPRRDRRHAGRVAQVSRTSPFPTARWCPQTLDGLLACGRHISCDTNSHGFMREIPQCWITGQAAGVAAAIAVKHGIEAARGGHRRTAAGAGCAGRVPAPAQGSRRRRATRRSRRCA